MSLVINSCSEIPTIYLNIYMLENPRLGRRNSMIILNLVTFLLHLFSVFYINGAVLFLARFFMKTSFSLMFVITVESYPTLIRSLGFSVNLSFGRLGPFLMPFVIFQLYHFDNSYPFILMAIFSLLIVAI